jgi:Nucleotidyltransferase domain
MIAARFEAAVDALRALEHQPRYLGALIFGSVAEGVATHHSDLDAVVLVDEDNPCPNVNHPAFWGHKVDITFRSLGQIEDLAATWAVDGARRPPLSQALILFDKTGRLHALRERLSTARPSPPTRDERQFLAFMVYHADDKVRRYLREDPDAALYSMHACVGELLKIHFRLQGVWWVSSKKVLASLDQWDRPLAGLIRRFLSTGDVEAKFEAWSEVVEHVLIPLGGRRPISENNCDCAVCTADLTALRQAVA